MSQASPECDRTNEHLLDYAYGELSGAPLAELEKHLPGCERCQADLAALKGTRRVMASLAPVPAPAGGLDSLLAYAEQQAKRQQKPARPKWLGWLMGAVPVAAAVVIVTTLSLNNTRSPALKATEEAPGSVAVARPSAEAEAGEAKDVAKNGAPKPGAPPALAKAPEAVVAAAPTPAMQPAPEPVHVTGRIAGAPPAKTMSAKGGMAMGAKADLAERDEEKAAVAYKAPAADKAEKRKANAEQDFDRLLGGQAVGGDMGSVAQGGGAGAAGPGGASRSLDQQNTTKDAKAMQQGYRVVAPAVPTDAAPPVQAQAAPMASKPDTSSRLGAGKSAQKEQDERRGDGIVDSASQVAEMDSNVASAPAPAQAAPPPPAMKQAQAPAATLPAEQQFDLAQREEAKPAKPAAHAANKKAEAGPVVAATGSADPSAGADALAQSGNHAGAAAAWFAAYQAAPSTSRGANALFNAATESQKAGLYGQAAMWFQRFADEFPKSAYAPAALATAVQIRRSHDGEGAATTLEDNLLSRYPESQQAQEVARHRRAHAPAPMKAKAEKKSMDFDDSSVERAAPAPAAPAATEMSK
ncbi:MAG: zf-HC2 domain-containing protein [Deltaproteobacteria bacterium]|nr:zf-HC2 domain-containing protein [Deltaproteobacteria bacterium]